MHILQTYARYAHTHVWQTLDFPLFTDFLGTTDIRPEDGIPVLENVETIGEFASLFRKDYDKIKISPS